MRQPNNENCKRLYNLLRNRVNRELKKSLKNNIMQIILRAILTTHKKTWDGIREIVNSKKKHTKTSQLIIGGKIIDDDQELATNFNEFFVDVGPSTENIIPKVPNISPTKFLKNRNQTNFVIVHISNEKILDIISSLENKSTGPTSEIINIETRFNYRSSCLHH